MKGFFIAMAVIVLAGVLILANANAIGHAALDKVIETEGGTEGRNDFDKLRQDHPDQFKEKYEDALKYRTWIAKTAFYLGGDELFSVVVPDTRDRYLNSPFEGDDEFGIMLFHYAIFLEDRRRDQQAYPEYKEILEKFPNCSAKTQIQEKFRLIKMRLNIGD
jgi:hypothetical protein